MANENQGSRTFLAIVLGGIVLALVIAAYFMYGNKPDTTAVEQPATEKPADATPPAAPEPAAPAAEEPNTASRGSHAEAVAAWDAIGNEDAPTSADDEFVI